MTREVGKKFDNDDVKLIIVAGDYGDILCKGCYFEPSCRTRIVGICKFCANDRRLDLTNVKFVLVEGGEQ